MNKIMSVNFEHTVSALCYSIIHQRCQQAASASTFPHNQVVRFVLRQHRRMPDFLQFPIRFLTLLFDLWGIIQAGSLFHRQPHSQRWRQIESWKQSSLGICRDFIRVYESLTLVYFYSNTTIDSSSEAETPCLNPLITT